MTLFFLILLAVATAIFFYQRSRKNKKPLLKPSLPVTTPIEPQKPVAPPAPASVAPEPLQAAPVPPQPVIVLPPPFAPPPPNPFRQRMSEISEELSEPELSEPKPPPNLPIG